MANGNACGGIDKVPNRDGAQRAMAYIMRFAADNVREVVITGSGHWLVWRSW